MDISLAPTIHGRRRTFCCHKARLSGRYLPNSLEAVAECVAARVPRLEVDVQFLRDDAMLIYHDGRLELASTGSGIVTALDRGSAKALRYLGEGDVHIAFLEDVVDLVRGTDTLLQIDLKLLTPFTPGQLAVFLALLAPLGEQVVIGSQAHWNVRRLAGRGHRLAIDPTWHWNRRGSLEDGIGAGRMTYFGLFDDSPLPHVPGVSAEDYVRERLLDVRSLVPEATEWMVDYDTIMKISDLSRPLGQQLEELGISLTAWTLRDRGEEITGPLVQMMLGLGATTIITDNALALAGYAVRGQSGSQPAA